MAVGPTATQIQYARATWLRDQLLAERWSLRKLEAATGIKKGAIARRFAGHTELSVSDIEVFAPLLRMNPEQLFARLRAVEVLPGVDSNHEPIGSTSALENNVTPLHPRTRRDETPHTKTGTVTPIKAAASKR